MILFQRGQFVAENKLGALVGFDFEYLTASIDHAESAIASGTVRRAAATSRYELTILGSIARDASSSMPASPISASGFMTISSHASAIEHAVAFDRPRDVGHRFDGRKLRPREIVGQRQSPSEIGAFAVACVPPLRNQFQDERRAAILRCCGTRVNWPTTRWIALLIWASALPARWKPHADQPAVAKVCAGRSGRDRGAASASHCVRMSPAAASLSAFSALAFAPRSSAAKNKNDKAIASAATVSAVRHRGRSLVIRPFATTFL